MYAMTIRTMLVCDGCGAERQLAAAAPWDVDGSAAGEGWLPLDNGLHLCAACIAIAVHKHADCGGD